jgi:hypothetical protein
VLGLYFSTIFNRSDLFGLSFGLNSDQMGLLAWTALIIIGIHRIISSSAKSILLIYSIIVANIVVLISLLMHQFYLEYRMFGLLLQPSLMGMYSLMTIVLTLYYVLNNKNKINSKFFLPLFLLNGITILLTTSRAAIYCLFFILLYLFINRFIPNKKSIVLVFGCLTFSTISIFILKSRLSVSNLLIAFDYRLKLVISYINTMDFKTITVGNGANAINDRLNSNQALPGPLQKSLEDGYIFLSSHNLFIDTLYYFGILFFMGLVMLTVYALYRSTNLFINYKYEIPYFSIIFLIMLVNAIINPPSLELTSLFLISTLALQNSKLEE